MGKNGSEALIVVVDGNVGLRFSPTVDELLHTLHIFTGLSVRLAGLSYDNAFNWFASDVLNKPVV